MPLESEPPDLSLPSLERIFCSDGKEMDIRVYDEVRLNGAPSPLILCSSTYIHKVTR